MRPEIHKMLPSQARTAIYAYLLERIKEAGLDYRQMPVYRLEDANQDLLGDKYDWGPHGSLVKEGFTAAMKEFDLRYPLSWDNDTQRTYRANLKP